MKKSNTYFIGEIVEIIDPLTYEIKVNIPGVNEDLSAFPVKSELDQPIIGDLVLLKCLDSLYQSYFIYQKIKENEFIGVRSNGKMIDISKEKIRISTFDSKYTDEETPEPLDYIELDSDGNMEISLRQNATITVNGSVNIKGSDITIDGGNVDITGGILNVSGSVIPGESGPFNCLPKCLYTGVPHVGTKVINT